MIIEEIGIENFRTLRSVRIEDFSNINVIVGRNNCGKTSVLEALFLGMYSSPQLLFQNRGLSLPEQVDGFLQLFYGRSKANSPCIDMGRYKAELNIKQNELLIRYSSQNEQFGVITVSVDKGSWKEEGEMDSAFLHQTIAKQAKFLPVGDDALDFDLHGVETILDDGEEDTVTQMLQNIDPSITGWIMGVQNTVRVQVNDKKRMIINLMGDGTRKAFALCTKLYSLKNGVILVDEVENGLHYESITVVVKFILHFVKKFPGMQVFITTHSSDVLRSLDALMDEEPERENLISVYSLNKYDGDESSVWRHDRASLHHALECEIELR